MGLVIHGWCKEERFHEENGNIRGIIMSDTYIIVVFTILLLVILVLYVFEISRTRRILNHISNMLLEAKNGTFIESCYDETKLSSVEGQMKEWIASSITTSNQLEKERDCIKTTISDISHQTKTPISNISIYTELLSEQELPEDSKEYVQRLREQSQKLNFLIEALVKSSRLETKVVSILPKEHLIEDILEQICDHCDQKAKSRGILITKEIEPCSLQVDAKWTSEALLNILDNAIKYADEATIIKVVGIKYPMFYRIDITNRGIEVKQEEVNAIFGRFFRSDNVRDEDGVGLGLYLAREIVTLQGGYIKVKPGTEPTFSVFIPC